MGSLLETIRLHYPSYLNLLAKLHFGQYAARVSSAVSVVWMALTGSMLAVVWRYIPVGEDEK